MKKDLVQEPNGKTSSSRIFKWIVSVIFLAMSINSYVLIILGKIKWDQVSGFHEWFLGAFFGAMAPYVFNKLSTIGKGE